jgi:hypothetical protein
MKKILTIAVIFTIVFLMLAVMPLTTAAQVEPTLVLELAIPDTARTVDFDDRIYVVGTSSGSLYVINEAGEYTVTDLGADYFINDVRIENSFIVVAANHICYRGEYYYDGTYYRYAYFDGGYVIKFVLDGLTPVELWRTYIAAWGSWYEYRWDGISLYENFALPSVDISSDGNYVAYLSRSTVGVLSGDDGAPIASYSIAGAYIVSWLDATADMEYIAITCEVGPPEAEYWGVNTGVELYRFDHVAGTLTKQWGRILMYYYETTEVTVSEAKNYVAAATSSGTFMNLLNLSTGEVLWQYETPGKEQFACDGDDNLNYVIGGTQAWSPPYSWFILRNLGASYEVVAEGEMVGAVNDMDSTPDASYFAFGSDAGEVILIRGTDNSIETIYSFNIDKMIDSIEIGTHTFLVGGENFIHLYAIKGVRIIWPEAGKTFWIEAEPEPTMPTINCQAKVFGITPNPTATTKFEWEVVITYTDHGRNDVHKFESGKVIGGAWTPDFKNVIAGGTLTIKVKAVIDGKEYQDSVTGHIRGRNPDKETIKETLGTLILQVICYKESYPKWHQFDDSGLPIFGPPGGFGLMQLDTPPPTSKQIWSWLENIKGGKPLWREKLAMSKNYVKQVQEANPDQKVPNLSPEQHERQAAYLYRGAAWVDGEWQYYYIWNRDTKQWEVNPKGDAISIAYANDVMNIKADIIAGNPPPGW